MKYVKRQMHVAEVTKVTAMGLVLTALALFGGGDASERALDEQMKGLASAAVVEESEQREVSQSSDSDGDTEGEGALYDIEFVDDSGNRLTVLVDSGENRVLRVEGESFDVL